MYDFLWNYNQLHGAKYSLMNMGTIFGSVSSTLCVCENCKGYVVKHNYVNLMFIGPYIILIVE